MERLFDTIPEYTDDIRATVKGTIPSWLEGNLYRLGPGKFDLSSDFSLNHWFDGCALVYKITIRNQEVSFKSRFLDTVAYQKMCNVERPVFTEFGTRSFPDPCKNIFSRFFSQIVPIEMTDNTVANIFPVKDDIFCSSETCHLWKVDADSLETLEKTDLSKLVSVNMASSHPQRDSDGSIYNLGASLMTGLKYHIIKIHDSNKKQESKCPKSASICCTISSNWSTCLGYYHSFGMSENYFIFVEQPLLINTMRLATCGVKGYSLKDCLDWAPKEKTRFHIVEKSSGRALKTKYLSDALFLFHHINAYEEDGHIVVDVIAFDDAEILNKFYLDKLRANIFDTNSEPQPRRYVIPLLTKQNAKKDDNLVKIENCTSTAIYQGNGVVSLTYEPICTPGLEMPSINRTFNTRKYRYFYGSGVFEQSTFRNAICKIDIVEKSHKMWRESDSMYPGEVTFIPSPASQQEDDGILLTTVIDVEPGKPDFLLILDGMTFTEIARADINPDVRVPYSAHGFFKPI